jgi:hypothetical protein
VVSSTTSTTINGLVAAYGFNEGQGLTTADLSGRGNNGTISGATWAGATSGRFGNALVFNGTSNFVNVADSASLDMTNALTLEAYVFPTVAPTGWRTIVAKETAGGLVYFLHANDNTNRPFMGFTQGGAERNVSAVAALAVNVWTHLAATYDGANQRFYVNGTQVSTRAQTGAIDVSTGSLRIGGTAAYGEFFQGRIDEVRIYNRALSAAEIVADRDRAVP